MSRFKQPESGVAPEPVPAPVQRRQEKKKVLFVCIGNSCRSQMAEGFARTYGADVFQIASAGLAPASIVQALTKKVMRARGIDISTQYPKALHEAPGMPWDVVVNMSGEPLPRPWDKSSLTWNVKDPIGLPESIYEQVARQIEDLVMRLILEHRQR